MFFHFIPLPSDNDEEESNLVKEEIVGLMQCCGPRQSSHHIGNTTGTHMLLPTHDDQSLHHGEYSNHDRKSAEEGMELEMINLSAADIHTNTHNPLTRHTTTTTAYAPIGQAAIDKEEDDNEDRGDKKKTHKIVYDIEHQARHHNNNNNEEVDDELIEISLHSTTHITPTTTSSTDKSTSLLSCCGGVLQPSQFTMLFLENFYILFWISKDLFWSAGTGDFLIRSPRSLIIGFECIAMLFGSLAIYIYTIIAYGYYRYDTIKFLDALTIICWIGANYCWMCGEFFIRYDHLLLDDGTEGNDTLTRCASMTLFLSGIAIQWYLAIYFFLLQRQQHSSQSSASSANTTANTNGVANTALSSQRKKKSKNKHNSRKKKVVGVGGSGGGEYAAVHDSDMEHIGGDENHSEEEDEEYAQESVAGDNSSQHSDSHLLSHPHTLSLLQQQQSSYYNHKKSQHYYKDIVEEGDLQQEEEEDGMEMISFDHHDNSTAVGTATNSSSSARFGGMPHNAEYFHHL